MTLSSKLPILYFAFPQILHKPLFSNALGDTEYSHEHLKAIVYAKFGGQKKCTMENAKKENYFLINNSSLSIAIFLYNQPSLKNWTRYTEQYWY